MVLIKLLSIVPATDRRSAALAHGVRGWANTVTPDPYLGQYEII